MKKAAIVTIFTTFLFCLLASSLWGQPPLLGEPPHMDNRTHRIGNVGFTVTNFGQFGNGWRGMVDPWTGELAPSGEFPLDSGLEYLFAGSIWVGAIVDGDTLVSAASDGWWVIREMYPLPYPRGTILFDHEKCDLRFIAAYYDTSVGPWVDEDPYDGPHRPIGIKIEQRSYSWADPPYDDFIIVEYDVTNISGRSLNDVYLGLHVDGDVLHFDDPWSPGAQDDISGFIDWWHSGQDSSRVDIAWICDNDGDPTGGQFDDHSPTSVSGVKVLKPPGEESEMTFNWWISDGNLQYDWGPQRLENHRVFYEGNLGTPTGDACRYYVMSNGEFDYDQVWTSYEFPGWIPPPPQPYAWDIANGKDTRYLISYGPFGLAEGENLSFTIAYLFGADFHTDPNGFNPHHPESTLYNFDDFTSTALWAEHIYDSLFAPAVVTIELVPDQSPVIVPRGGSFGLTATVTNQTNNLQWVDIWLMAYVPGIGMYGPLRQFNHVLFNPNQSRSAHLNQSIPNNAPISDEYVYYGYVGDYPTTVIDSSYFPFEVIPGRLTKAGENGWVLTGSFLEGDLSDLPSEFALLSNYPNPFNASTVIEYQLPVTSTVKLEIYNLLGEKVATLIDERQDPGQKSVVWDALEVSSGLYFYKLTAGDYTQTKRMMLVR